MLLNWKNPYDLKEKRKEKKTKDENLFPFLLSNYQGKTFQSVTMS